jgi:hypothetical protein
MRRLACSIVLASATAACGGAPAPASHLGPPPAAETTATLASSRCSGTTCKCRTKDDASKEDPPKYAGYKRFELRVDRGPGQVWITIDGKQQLYPDIETSESCFYVDLGPGEHQIELRGKAVQENGGVGAALQLSEYSPGPDKQPPWWYDTAIFQCGHPGPCEPDALRSWKEEVEGYARALRDPCGSTKVKRPQWETGVLPDGVHPDEFYASFALDVYPFIPKAGPGDCDKARSP